MRFRDRFFTKPVARAITSPGAIIAAGGGAAIGILVGLGPIGAIIGAVIGAAARVGVAIPRSEPSVKIDPFTLSDPWNRLMSDALAARTEFNDATRRSKHGPLGERLQTIGHGIDESVDECWAIAKAGHALGQARARINVPQIQRELSEVQSLRAQGSNPTLDATAASLVAQLDTATRMDTTLVETQNRLRLLNARLDEAVTRCIELSVTSTDASDLGTVDDSVSSILTEMEALRAAVSEVREISAGPAQTPAWPQSSSAAVSEPQGGSATPSAG
jgi:hypothetical protein